MEKVSDTKSCATLLQESIASIVLSSGQTKVGEGCHGATGCDGGFCVTCNANATAALQKAEAKPLWKVQWFGRCCNGRSIQGPQIIGPNRDAVIDVAKQLFCEQARRECCPRVVCCYFTVHPAP